MKKLLIVLAISMTMTYCNTPQPTTTNSGMDTSMNSSTDMNQSTTTDTSGGMRDSVQQLQKRP